MPFSHAPGQQQSQQQRQWYPAVNTRSAVQVAAEMCTASSRLHASHTPHEENAETYHRHSHCSMLWYVILLMRELTSVLQSSLTRDTVRMNIGLQFNFVDRWRKTIWNANSWRYHRRFSLDRKLDFKWGVRPVSLDDVLFSSLPVDANIS